MAGQLANQRNEFAQLVHARAAQLIRLTLGVKIVEASGLDYELHAMGTIVEGELDQVLAVLRDCFNELAADCQRVSCAAKFDYRQGPGGRIRAKVASVESKLK